jgi:Cellulose binding domain
MMLRSRGLIRPRVLIPVVGLISALAAAFALTTRSGPGSIIDTGASGGCSVSYRVSGQWNTGFTAALTITNRGSPITSWNLQYAYPGNQSLSQGWSGHWAQRGSSVTVTSESWNDSLAADGSVQIGANFGYSGTNTAPNHVQGQRHDLPRHRVGLFQCRAQRDRLPHRPSCARHVAGAPAADLAGQRPAAAGAGEHAGQRERTAGRAARRGPVLLRGGHLPKADARGGAGRAVLDLRGQDVQRQRRGSLRPVQRALPGEGRQIAARRLRPGWPGPAGRTAGRAAGPAGPDPPRSGRRMSLAGSC